MTSKIQITDEMVERAAWSLRICRSNTMLVCKSPCGECSTLAKTALEAALNPEEPEIPVSEAMLKAGATLWRKGDNYGHPWWAESGSEAIYRAMEKARRKEEVPQQRFHCREGEMRPGGILRAHRRKGDPK